MGAEERYTHPYSDSLIKVCKWLQVEIDDRLPVSRSGELLCSHSSNRDEFWVSIIEKAYMKVGSRVGKY